MNKIYKVVWSKVKNCYVVVSEIAKSHSKPVSRGSRQYVSAAAVLAAFAVLSISNVAAVQAVDVKLGDNAATSNYANQVGSIAIGNNSYVENMAGTQENLFSFGQTDQTQWAAGIAIGQNAYARSGSVMLGDHKYIGALGDTTVEGTSYNNVKSKGVNIYSTTVGANSYNQGAFSTVNGAFSIISGRYNGGFLTSGYAGQNFGAVVTGALNSIESATTTNRYSGIANSIVGTANRTFNSNGSLIFGAGNEITNSTTTISAPSSGGASAKELQTNLMTSIRNSESGGATLAIGGGNTADYTQKTSIIGVNNTVTGTSSNISQYNSVTGFNNTATNVDNTIVLGTNRTVSDLADTVVIGTADSALATTASDAVAIGSNANATVDGGVALGSSSVASVASGVAGYDPTTNAASTTDSATWKSTLGAVSVGVPTDGGAATATRQITGVAAGLQDTDAVNVAQLKSSKVTLTPGENVTIDSVTNADGTTYTIKATDTNTTLASGTVSYTDGDGTLVLTDSAGNNVTVSGLKNTYVTSGALSGNTLTLTRNDGGTVTVDGIASSTDITNLTNTVNANKTHYFAVNSTDGNNYNNNGATGADAIAIGKNASTQANGSIAIGLGASISDSSGGKGTGDIAIGNGAHINNYVDQGGGIALGSNAFVENMAGGMERTFDFNQAGYDKLFGIPYGSPKDASKMMTGVAIGQNTYARTGSVMLGTHNYSGALGDVTVDRANTKAQNMLLFSTTVGANSYTNGLFSTVTGAYSIASSDYTGGTANAVKNFGSTITGSLNSNESSTASSQYSGIANSIVGLANRTANANGALIFGAGNEITNSVTNINAPTSSGDSAVDLQKTLMSNIKSSASGGSTLAFGGGNKADYTRSSALIGVNNTLTGTESDISQYNYITGYNNTGTNVDNVSIIGTNRTVSDANNSIVIGSADSVMSSTASDAVTIGRNANTTVNGGVALGSGSVASVAAEVAGYDVVNKAASTETSATWKSTLAAVSVGVPTDGGAATATRQITGVAAGMQDTDAVNVAQLKQVAAAAETAGNTTLNFTGDDTTATIARGNGQTLNITGGATEFTTADNIGVVKDGDNALKVKLAKDLNMTDGSIAFNNGVKLSSAGLSNGGQKITNVAAGEADTDAVNVSQLKGSTLKSGTATYADNGTGSMTLTMENGDTVTVNGLQDKYINGASLANNTLTITRNDGTNFTVNNIATMDDISNQVGDVALNFAGDDATAKVTTKNNGTLNITGGAASDNLTDDNIGVVKSADDTLQVKLSKDLNNLNSVRVGGSKEGEGIYIAKQSVNNSKGVAEEGNYITGLTNKTWNPAANGFVSGRAATEDQLNSVYEKINQNIESSKAVSGKNITVDENNKVNLNDNITLGGDTAANQVNINGNDAKVTAGDGANKVVVDGTNGQVTIGEAGKDLVLGNQTVEGTKTDNGKDSQSGKFLTGLDNTKWDPATQGIVENRAATEGQLKNVADNISKQISDIDTAVKSTSRVFESDSGADAQVTRKSTDPMKLKGGADANNLSDNNIGVVNNSDKTGFDIKLSKDIKGLNSIEVNNKITIGTGDNQTIIEGDTINTGSVTTGNTTINNDGLTIVNEDSSKNITINNNNVNMGGNVIKNIGEGSEPTDAINKTQFDRAINNLGTGMNQINNRVNKLDNRVNRVGAGAAALAALHPLEFSPDAKWEVTAGVGNYRGANAIALGAFYRPNFDTMFSIGTSYGGGENMINAGVTWRIGEGETKAYPSKTVMAQEIDDLKNVVSEQQDQIEELKKLVNSLINK